MNASKRQWLQIRGDPSVRRFLFEQQRVINEFDRKIDHVLERTELLLRDYGVFHAKIHFSSGQVTLWSLDDPLRYRVCVKEEFLEPELCRRRTQIPYSSLAVVPQSAIAPLLLTFKRLRTQDSQIYLRTGSINIINGVAGMTFSCDGSHYINYADLLAAPQIFFGLSTRAPC